MIRIKQMNFEKAPISIVVLFFFLIYGFSIAGIDMRYPFLVFVFFYILIKFKCFTIPKYVLKVEVYLLSMSLYALLITLLNSTGDYFEFMRFMRCLVTCILISGVVWHYKISPLKMLNVLEILLILNSVVVIVTILNPNLKPYFEVINQYTKTYSRWRAIGLLNGEDAAGFFCNIGLTIETLKRMYNKQGPITWKSMLYIVSTIFTSRMAMAFSILIMIICLLIMLKRKDFKHATGIIILLVPVLFFGGILWIITTNVAPELRDPIYMTFPFLKSLYSQLTEGYIDYAVYSKVISNHTSIEGLDCFQIIFGAGYRTMLHKDVGYLKTIYSIGSLGVISEVLFYIKCFKNIKKNYINQYPYYIVIIYAILSMLVFMWEFKNSFVFSSGVFEIITALYFSMIFNKKENKFEREGI